MFFNFRYRPMSLQALLDHNLIHLRDMALAEFISYLVFALAFFLLLVWLRSRNSFRFRIRKSLGTPKQIGREFFNSVRSIVVYNGTQLGLRILVLAFGYIVTFDQHFPLWWTATTFVLVMAGHETYFYWTHRWMHTKGVFRLIHWEHHRSVGPTVFSAHSFSIIEAMIDGSYPVVFMLFCPCGFETLVFFQFVQILHDVAIHSGVDVFPRALVTGKRFGWLCGTVHHDMHHALGRSNYALYTRVWDRLMKTEHPDFDRIYEYVHSPQNDGNAYKLLSRAQRDGPAREAPAGAT